MTKHKLLGAITLGLALFLIVPGAFAAQSASLPQAHSALGVVLGIAAALGLIGTAVVTYGFPVSGTTAPTAIQASGCYVMTAQVTMADADTQAAFTHNWGLPASFPGFFFPEVSYWCQQAGIGAQTFNTALTFALTNTNVMFINKANALASGGTFIVTIRRPHSLGQ